MQYYGTAEFLICPEKFFLSRLEIALYQMKACAPTA